MPFYMDDGSIAIYIEPDAHLPQTDATYSIGTNHTILNPKGENVTEYIKIYLYNHIQEPESIIYRNDSDNTIESSLRWGVWTFILYDLETENYPDVFKGFMKSVKDETLEYYNTYGPVADEGILADNITHYKINFLDNTNTDINYQNLLSVKTWLEDSNNMAWAWKLVNMSTTENRTEIYTVNVTEDVPYNTTEEYTENVTEYVPVVVVEDYPVNVTVEVPYNVTEEYTENITYTVPVNKTEIYYVNVTKEVPYNVTEEYTENITVDTPGTTVNNIHQVKTETIIKDTNTYKNSAINSKGNKSIQKVNKYNGKVINNHNNIIKASDNNNLSNVKEDTVIKTRNKTLYKNVTVQEEREKTVTYYENKTEQVTKNRTITQYKNVTTTQIRQRNVTNYTPVTREVVKNRTVTKYKQVTHEEERNRTVSVLSRKYMLYIYLLYLDGNISYADLVAIIGEENLQFNEDGSIELSFTDLEEVPDTITVKSCDETVDVPVTSDEVDTSNPDNLDEPVIDAGIVNAEL